MDVAIVVLTCVLTGEIKPFDGCLHQEQESAHDRVVGVVKLHALP